MSELPNTGSGDLSALKLDKGSFGRKTARRRLVVPILLVVAVVLAGAVVVLYGRAAGPTLETITVPPPGRPDGDVTLTATGYVVARRKAAVGPKIPGRVTFLGVEEGSFVKEGSVIARLDAVDLEANVLQAEARVSASNASLAEAEASQVALDLEANRRTVLFVQGLGAKQDADATAAEASAGRSRVRAAKDRVAAERAGLGRSSGLPHGGYLRGIGNFSYQRDCFQ